MVERPFAIGLGEALFDRFGERALLGGAPANFATHAGRMLSVVGGEAGVISAVGDDAMGERLRTELTIRGVRTDGLQIRAEMPTGVVDVTVNGDGQPTYRIAEPAAWDHIEADWHARTLAAKADAICFGTLARRNGNAASFDAIIAAAPDAIRVFDLNLRQEYYSPDALRHGLEAATVVKLNEEEAQILAELCGIGGDSAESIAASLRIASGLDVVALTRGADGTALATSEGLVEGAPAPFEPEADADSVGAGDSCCAAITVGLLMGLEHSKIAGFANAVGAFVASRSGATPRLPDELLAEWIGAHEVRVGG